MDEVDLGAAVGLVFFHVVFEELVEGFLGLAGEMADLLKQGLEEEGHSVVVSGRGPDALAIAQHHAFDARCHRAEIHAESGAGGGSVFRIDFRNR